MAVKIERSAMHGHRSRNGSGRILHRFVFALLVMAAMPLMALRASEVAPPLNSQVAPLSESAKQQPNAAAASAEDHRLILRSGEIIEDDQAVDFATYMRGMQMRIKSHWEPSRQGKTNRVVCQFKLHADGSITDSIITQSSEVEEVDAAALKAVTDSNPLEAPPAVSHKNGYLDIQFTFDYNIIRGRPVLKNGLWVKDDRPAKPTPVDYRQYMSWTLPDLKQHAAKLIESKQNQTSEFKAVTSAIDHRNILSSKSKSSLQKDLAVLHKLNLTESDSYKNLVDELKRRSDAASAKDAPP